MPGGAHIVHCVLAVVFIHGSSQPPPRHNACGHEIPLQTNKNGSTCQSTVRLDLSVNLSKLLRNIFQVCVLFASISLEQWRV